MGLIEATGTIGRGVPAALIDLSRGRQAMLSVAQPALGAMIASGGALDGRIVLLGFLAASAGYLAVFSLNDVLDRSADVRAGDTASASEAAFDLDTMVGRHPIAAGRLSMSFSLAWVGGLGAISAIASWMLAPACLLTLVTAVMLEWAYCSLRSVTWLKTFVSGAMVAVGGLAGWIAVAALDIRAAPFLAFLFLWEIACRNLPNDLADVHIDSRAGIRTVATVLGPTASATGTLVGAALGVVAAGLLPVRPILRIAWVAVTAFTILFPAASLTACPLPAAAARYFNRASLAPAVMLLAGLPVLSFGMWSM